MEVGKVVQGHINEVLGLNKDIKNIRLNICKKCPLYTPRFGGMCNNKLWYNVNSGDVSITYKDGYIRGCGCRLQAKTTLVDEKCPAGKW